MLRVHGDTTQPIFTVTVNGVTAEYLTDYNWQSDGNQSLTSPETITVGVVAPDGSTSMTYTVVVSDP